MSKPRTSPGVFFEKYVLPLDFGCHVWTGSLDKLGYGRIWIGDGHMQAHKFGWMAKHGPVPDGCELDHLCRVRPCVNEAHLEPVPHVENVRRGACLKTHCVNGHSLDEHGYVFQRTDRQYPVRRCRLCRKTQDQNRSNGS